MVSHAGPEGVSEMPLVCLNHYCNLKSVRERKKHLFGRLLAFDNALVVLRQEAIWLSSASNLTLLRQHVKFQKVIQQELKPRILKLPGVLLLSIFGSFSSKKKKNFNTASCRSTLIPFTIRFKPVVTQPHDDDIVVRGSPISQSIYLNKKKHKNLFHFILFMRKSIC